MAKALYGHIGSIDPRQLDAAMTEVRKLRARVSELETALDHAWSANDSLHRELGTVRSVDAELATLTSPVLA